MEYKCLNVGLKKLPKFSNQRLGVYAPHAHENSNQSLIELLHKESSYLSIYIIIFLGEGLTPINLY